MKKGTALPRAGVDRRDFRRKYMLDLASDPATLIPGVVGATLLMGSWALGIGGGLSIFAGMAGVLSGAGMFFTRLAVGDQAAAQRALDEMQEDVRRERNRQLDELRSRLEADGDPRTQACLDDLRALARDFEAMRALGGEFDVAHLFEIAWSVDELFCQGVESLERSLNLIETARGMSSAQLKESLLKRRDGLVKDVEESVERLGGVLASVNDLGAWGEDSSKTARIRAELDEQLAVARRVAERMRTIEGSTEDAGPDPLGSREHSGRES